MKELNNQTILEALKDVMDPDLKQSLVSLNMIQNIKIEKPIIKFDVVLTTPACPLKELIKRDCIVALTKYFGNEYQFDLNMTSKVTTTRFQNTSLLAGVKNIIAISSGKGGVGKSTVAANLAVALAKSGAEVGLIDADIFGPSIPTMFNCEYEKPAVQVIDGQNKLVPILQYGVKLISIGFMAAPDAAVVWRGPMASSALKQFMSEVVWGDLDYLLIDLPPGTSDIHLTMVQTVPITGAIIVTTPQKVALADAQKGIAMFKQKQINVPILGIVENMAYFTPAELPDHKYFIFGQDGGKKLAEKNDLILLGQMPIVQSVRESGDSGYPVVLKDEIISNSFSNLAETLAQQVAILNAKGIKSKVVDITS